MTKITSFPESSLSPCWSRPKLQTLHRCIRAYRFKYLLARDGWKPEASAEEQSAYRYSLLTSESLLAGILVHQQIRTYLALHLAHYSQAMDELIEQAGQQFIRFVATGQSLSLEACRRGRSRLVRQQRGESLAPTEMAHWTEHIGRCLRNWRDLPLTATLLSNKGHLVRDLLDPKQPLLTECLGVPMYLKTDAVAGVDQRWTVYDWKTGQPSDADRSQAAIYDAFIRDRMGLPDGASVTVSMVYLPNSEVIEHTFTADERTELRWQIGEQLEDIAAVEAGNHFPARPSHHCDACAFQFLCTDGQRFLTQAKGGVR